MSLPFKLDKQGLHHAKAVLGLWDPIGLPARLKVSEYEGYLGSILEAYPDVHAMSQAMLKLEQDILGIALEESDMDTRYVAEELKRVLDFYKPSKD